MYENDARAWPFLYTKVDGRPTTTQELDAFLEELWDLTHLGEPFVQLVDARDARLSPATERQRFAQWTREVEPAGKKCLLGVGIVITSPIVRGGLTAAMWLKKPAWPQRACGTLEEAADFCIECVAKDGRPCSAPAHIRAWVDRGFTNQVPAGKPGSQPPP